MLRKIKYVYGIYSVAKLEYSATRRHLAPTAVLDSEGQQNSEELQLTFSVKLL